MLIKKIIFIAMLVALIGCAGGQQPKEVLREIPREDRIPIMVLNFKNITAGDAAKQYKPWEFGIPSMLMTDMETIGLFNILSWERIGDILEQQKFQNMGMVDERQAVEMGKIAAAKYTLTGTYMVLGGQIQMEAKVFSVEQGTMLGAASVSGELNKFFELEKRLLIDMTAYLGAMLSEDEKFQISGLADTLSVEASLTNYSGEMDLIRADALKAEGKDTLAQSIMDGARAKFESALRIDPSYARARNNLEGLAMAMPMTL